MSLLLLVVSALHILILVLLFVATLDKVSFQLTGNPSCSPSLSPHLPSPPLPYFSIAWVLCPRLAHAFGPSGASNPHSP